MIIELNILEAKIKKSMPLSMDLRFLNLAYEGLKKKQIYAEMRQKDESKRSHRNTTVDWIDNIIFWMCIGFINVQLPL